LHGGCRLGRPHAARRVGQRGQLAAGHRRCRPAPRKVRATRPR